MTNNIQLKVKTKIGLFKINVNNNSLPKGTCKNCGSLIYWLKTVSKKSKMQLTKTNKDEYVCHSLVCPTVIAYEERQRRKKMFKNNKK